MADWDRELSKIDKQLESISDDELIQRPAGATPAQQQAIVVERERTSTFGALARISLAVLLGAWFLSGCSSSDSGGAKARVGHHDYAAWNSTHDSRGCSQQALVGTGGDGLFYCFALPEQ